MPSDASIPPEAEAEGERTRAAARAETVPCTECGARPLDGYAHCGAMWDELLARSFDPLALGAYHRPIVDMYAMQHPRRYAVCANSYTVHLTGLCAFVELRDPTWINRRVQAWLDRDPPLLRPEPVASPGELTVDHVLARPGDAARALREWAAAIWAAHRPQHSQARAWIEAALGRPLVESDRVEPADAAS